VRPPPDGHRGQIAAIEVPRVAPRRTSATAWQPVVRRTFLQPDTRDDHNVLISLYGLALAWIPLLRFSRVPREITMAIRPALHALLVVLSLAAVPVSQAAILLFETDLAGSNEVPGNASPGTGTASVEIDTVLRTLRLEMEFTGLLGSTTASHIHCCALPGTNAGVATQLPTFINFPLGVSSGAYLQVFDMSLASSWNPAFITAQGGTPLSAFAVLVANMEAGRTYVNIHTSLFGGGEIRGNLQKVNEPTPLALLPLAGIAFVWMRRRSRA
jgi:hypothetical protein